jgi:hypothetical protein
MGTPRGRDSSEYVPWRLVTPRGRVVITDCDGRRELSDSYEDALMLARRWRS